MEPPGGLPPDKDKSIVYQQPNINVTTPAIQHQHPPQDLSLINVSTAASQQSLEKLSRPAAFDKMEALVKEMQDPENGVPVRQQKMFLTSIPYAFMGYDLIEWLMDRLSIEESEALSIANQLCLHGYFFPVNDTKSLVVKDDSSLYRFQTPYYWPWQHKAPDNVEYAIYLCKRSLRNKQRHGLEDYESEALASLHKNLKGKWDFISMQAEEQVRLAKERKKGDKIVGDSQERAYWRVHRPPPGQFTPLEPCPVPSRDRQGFKPKKRTADDWQREVDYLQKSLGRTRMKMSQVCESLVSYWETFAEYDFFQQPVLPSNPWVSEDTTFWQLNNAIVDIPTEKRVKRWGISIEELVSDPTGLQEFTTFLEKEYSHENIRFWIAVNKLRRSAHSQVARKVNEIYEEFLKPGAPCEINIDSKTMEAVQKGLKNPSRFTFDAAAEHIYMLLLKKDCYPRFIRSDHYKTLLASGIQPSHKKRFFGFGGVAKKKSSTAVPTIQSSQGLLLSMQASSSSGGIVPPPGSLSRRRGSDRSLTGSAHELAVIGVKDSTATMTTTSKVPHSHSQSNLSEIPYRETGTKLLTEKLEITPETGACAVCPWETSSITGAAEQTEAESSVCLAVCPWDDSGSKLKGTAAGDTTTTTASNIQKQSSSSSDVLEVSERMRRSCGLRQHTVDSDYQSGKRLIPHAVEQRRASMTVEPRLSDYQMTSTAPSKQSATQTRSSITPSPTEFSGIGSCVKEQLPRLDTTKKFTTNSSNNGSNNDNDQPKQQKQQSGTNVIIITDDDGDNETTMVTSPLSSPSLLLPGDNRDNKSKVETKRSSDKQFNEKLNNKKITFEIKNNEIETQTDDNNDETICESENKEIEKPLDSDDGGLALSLSNETEKNIVNISSNNMSQAKTSSSPTITITTTTTTTITTTTDTTITTTNAATQNIKCPNLGDVQNLNKCFVEMKHDEDHENNVKCSILIKNDHDRDHHDHGNGDNYSLSDNNKNRKLEQRTIVIGGDKEISTEQQQSVENDDNNQATLAVSITATTDIDTKDDIIQQEELSPTMEEYQECAQFVQRSDVFEYETDLDTNLTPGCVAPAPTPAPSLAPLAEIEMDPMEEEQECGIASDEGADAGAGAGASVEIIETTVMVQKSESVEETKKRRKKRDLTDAKKSSDEKTEQGTSQQQAKSETETRNAVCPWEDEDVSTSDTTFVKTYATLGYL